MRHVVSNGYEFDIDVEGRTRKVTGLLKLNPNQVRSRQSQAEAGGTDRLPTDQGGHYIARRFDGPTEAFNHFAQDAKVNSGRYRALENRWAAASKRSKSVNVEIMPVYVGESKRPSAINVRYSTDGHQRKVTIPNKRQENSRGK